MIELPPPFWLPAKPAIIRPADKKLLRLATRDAIKAQKASFLPGMFPSAVAGGGVAPKTLSFITSATGTQDVADNFITCPTVQAGDILALAHMGFGNSAPANFIPSGWTSIQTQASSNCRTSLAYKLAAGTESGTHIPVIFGNFDETSGSRAVMAVFRQSVAAASLTLGGAIGTNSTANPTAQNITSASGAAPLIVLAAYGVIGGAGVDPRTMSPAKTGEVNHTTFIYLAYKIYDSAPADVSIDMDDEGTGNMLMGGYIAIT